jgi:aliphatic nitrilase
MAFPEAFIPAFPVWVALQAPIYGHELFGALVANALRIDGPEIDRLRAARKVLELDARRVKSSHA